LHAQHTSPKASLVSALAPASDSGPSDSNTDVIPVPSSIVTLEAAHVSGISDFDTELTPAPARSPSQTPVPASVLVIGSSSPVPALAKAPAQIILLDSSPPTLRTDSQTVPSTQKAVLSLLLAPTSFEDVYETTEPIAGSSSTSNIQSDPRGIQRFFSSTSESSASGKAPKRKIQVAANSKPRATRVTARQVLITILLTILPSHRPIRSLCLADWRRENPTEDENKFKKYWKNIGDGKKVRCILISFCNPIRISSTFNASYNLQVYEDRVKARVRVFQLSTSYFI
jgi:hypothetical protein